MVLALRPTLADLFAGYALPDKEAAEFFNLSIQYLLRWGPRSSDPRHFFLTMLEGYCEAWAAAQEAEQAEEPPDDGFTPDA
jgi:hypothetical protein